MYKIVYYTTIYKIDSKFNFDKYLEWGKNLINQFENNLLIVFTNNETHLLIKDILKNDNINVINRELNDFILFRHLKYFKRNLRYFIAYNIILDEKLLMLYVERHLLIKHIMDNYNSEFYSYIDWGYIRDNINLSKWYINTELLEKKIYIGIVNYNKNDFINKVKLVNNNQIWIYKKRFYYFISGGFNIIHNSLVDFWINKIGSTIKSCLINNIDFKDDQIIIANISLNLKNINNFCFVNLENDWFFFRKLFSENEKFNLNDNLIEIR